MFSSPSLTTSLAAAPVPCRKQPAVLSTLTAPKLTDVQLVFWLGSPPPGMPWIPGWPVGVRFP